jgi:hypothetical protein
MFWVAIKPKVQYRSLMSHNLITAGIIDPTQFPLDRVQREVAVWLRISLYKIERLECWHHQAWVKIVGVGVKFVSYRCLPIWTELGLDAIADCSDRPSLEELGEILATETKLYSDRYQPKTLQQWRDAWAEQSQNLREEAALKAAEEERLKPFRAHQQEGLKWQESWQHVLRYCQDCKSLEYLAPEIKRQSETFADLPEVIGAIQTRWHQRWHELSQATA